MGELSKLGIFLTVIFSLFLFALLAELSFLLLRRRRHLRRKNLFSGDPSKDLLFFLCFHSRCRVKPDGSPVSVPLPETVVEMEEVMKLPELYGHSRVLFTIKEEEREELESEVSSERRVVLEEEKEVAGEPPAVTAAVVEVEVESPYITPCGSPPYYTPTTSPTREIKAQIQEVVFSKNYISTSTL